MVVSDLLTPEWEVALGRLPSRGGDVVVVHVLDPEELHPSLAGDLELVDRESGRRMAVSMAPETVERYRQVAEAWLERVAARCRQVGAGYVRLLTSDDLEATLLGAWRTAGVLR